MLQVIAGTVAVSAANLDSRYDLNTVGNIPVGWVWPSEFKITFFYKVSYVFIK